jgi:hypothetical protein
MGSEQVFVYVPEDQHRRWEEVAEQRDMGMSEFIRAHVEAGLKKFDREVTPDESARELRQQRNELRDELDHARQRIQDLEDRLYRGEPAEIERFVTENPAATYEEIVPYIQRTVPARVTRHLDDLEGDTLRVEDGAYYPMDDGDEEAGS